MNVSVGDPDKLVELFDLAPMPLEGGMFRRLWNGPIRSDGRSEGSSIVVLLARTQDTFSAMHRLPIDEVWHFYLGDPIELLLLSPDRSWRMVRLGHRVTAGEQIQVTVPAGTWMGARVCDEGEWSLFGCTMAPGFLPSDYEGGGLELCDEYPEAAPHIRKRVRPGAPLRHEPAAEPPH